MARIPTLFLIAFSLHTFAGSGGPDAFGYTWKDDLEPGGPVFSWIDITGSGTQVQGLADDNVVGPVVMQTNFDYYWYSRKNMWIGSNGYVAFNNGNIASPFPVIPNAAGVNDYIAGIMADLNFSGVGNPGQCWVLDEADRTIISFINVPFYSQFAPGYTGSNTFQIILDKPDAHITVQILQQMGLTMNNDITMGIESVAGSIGLQHSKNVYPPGNRAIRYYMPDVPLIQVTDVAVAWNTEEGSGGRFLSRNGANFQMVTQVSNIGSVNVGALSATGSVLNAAGQNQVNATQPISSLVAGADSIISFVPVFEPTTAGTFRFRTLLGGVSGDLVPSNNQLIQELVVVDTALAVHDLRYHGTTDDALGLSWTGGNGGVAMHLIPPYHPILITHTTVRIMANPLGVPFTMKVYADDGPGGLAGTLLDSVMISGAQAGPGDKVIPLSNEVVLNDGGIFVEWYMVGENVSIARDIQPPFSLRTYEVIDGTYAEYRDRENADFHLGVRLGQAPVIDVGCDGFFDIEEGEPITSSTPVRVYVRNYGNQPATNIPLAYRFNNGPIVTHTYTGTPIQPGLVALVTFPEDLVPITDAVGPLCAWTTLGPDNNIGNDTTCVNVQTITGISEQVLRPVVLAPNPATDRVRIDGLPAGRYALELWDATGRLVLRQEAVTVNGPLEWPLTSLLSGSYQLRLMGDSGRFGAALLIMR